VLAILVVVTVLSAYSWGICALPVTTKAIAKKKEKEFKQCKKLHKEVGGQLPGLGALRSFQWVFKYL
jgi:hypothetical protein